MNHSKKLKIMAGICFITFFGYVFLYETVLHGKITSTPVVQAKRDLEPNHIITPDDVYIGRVPNDQVNPKAFRNIKDVVGKRTLGSVSQFDVITEQRIGAPKLKIDEDESLISIPESWIASVPGSLRRLDSVDVWLIRGKNMDLTYVNDDNEPFLKNKVVAFVKNSQNGEVKGSEKQGDRVDALSQPNRVELILKNDEIAELKEKIQQGYLLMITYRENIS